MTLVKARWSQNFWPNAFPRLAPVTKRAIKAGTVRKKF